MYWPESVCRDLSGALGKSVSENGGKGDFEYHCTKGSVFLGAVNIMKYTQLGNKASEAENMTYTSALVFAGAVEKRNVLTPKTRQVKLKMAHVYGATQALILLALGVFWEGTWRYTASAYAGNVIVSSLEILGISRWSCRIWSIIRMGTYAPYMDFPAQWHCPPLFSVFIESLPPMFELVSRKVERPCTLLQRRVKEL